MRRETPPGKEAGSREEQSEHHQRRKAALDKKGPRCGRQCTYGDDDTYVGYASQRRTSRHEHGGRHDNLPMERLARRRLHRLLKIYRETAKSALTVSADFVVSNLTMRREYETVYTAYLPCVD